MAVQAGGALILKHLLRITFPNTQFVVHGKACYQEADSGPSILMRFKRERRRNTNAVGRCHAIGVP